MDIKEINIGVDIDNTIILEVNHHMSHINEHINPDFSFSDWVEWDMLKLFPDKKDDLIKFFKTYYSKENIHNMHPMENSNTFLSKFDYENIYYITARSDWLFNNPKLETLELLKQKDFPIKESNLILQKDTESKLKKCKSLIAKEKGILLFIEDNPDNALKISKFCPVLLIDYPFNRNLDATNVYRIGKFNDDTGEWIKNPWTQALEWLENGRLMQIIEPFLKS